MNTELRAVMRTIAPVFYLAAHVTVVALSILVVATVERRWGLHTWQSQGDIDAAVACLFFGGVIFPAVTLLMVRLDNLRQAGVTDHVRQSALVYALTIIAVLVVIANHKEQRYSLGFGVVAAAGLVGLYAAALNGLVLWVINRRKFAGSTPRPPSPAVSHP